MRGLFRRPEPRLTDYAALVAFGLAYVGAIVLLFAPQLVLSLLH